MKNASFLAAAIFALSFSQVAHSDTAVLTPQDPITVPGLAGKFDWMSVDDKMHRILASHPGTQSIAVYDTQAKTAQSIDCGGEVNGIALDAKDNKYFAGGGIQKIVIIDRIALTKTGEIDLTGPADDVVYLKSTGLVYADHDDGNDLWIIDPATSKVTGSVAIGEAPEYMQYDSVTKRIYQNIKSANEVQVVDPSTNKVEASWPTDPATSPHGLAVVKAMNIVLSAGKNGKIVALDTTTGKVTSSCDIKPGVDQIAYDKATGRVYCACKGFISVVDVTSAGISNVADIAVPPTIHTIAIDPETHNVWTCWYDDKGSYMQCFAVAASDIKTAISQFCAIPASRYNSGTCCSPSMLGTPMSRSPFTSALIAKTIGAFELVPAEPPTNLLRFLKTSSISAQSNFRR